jgi:hypothetical protein
MSTTDDNTISYECSVDVQQCSFDAIENSNSITKTHKKRAIRKISVAWTSPQRVIWRMYVFLFQWQAWFYCFFVRKRCFFSISNSAVTTLACCTFITVTMIIAILTVYFTTPKQSGMSFLLYILRILCGKNSETFWYGNGFQTPLVSGVFLQESACTSWPGT